MTRHPHHDEIAAEVRSWHLQPFPDMGYTAEPTWFGVMRANTQAPFASVTVTALDPHDVPRLLADVRDRYGQVQVDIKLYDGIEHGPVGRALLEHGCTFRARTAYLAHVGPRPDDTEPSGYTFEVVGPDGLEEFSRTKLLGFASNEDEPSAEDIAREVAFRQAETGGGNGFAIGRLDGEAAGITAWYGPPHALIFLVATRVPFRRRGVASAGIRAAIDRQRDARSVLINADVDDTPIHLYRRLGFTDEVHRDASYVLPA